MQVEVPQTWYASTVRDLVAGSAISSSKRGVAELKGIPGEWRAIRR